MIVERHIFGSVTGYRTLACSPGISSQEGRQLEAFSFGQPSSQAFVESLVRNPAYWIRSLAARRVLSRLVPGAPDEQGRTTLLIYSAVVSAADWDGVLRADVGLLLRTPELWKWDGTSRLAPLDVSVTPSGRISVGRSRAPLLLNLISRIERGAGRPASLVIREADFGPDEARCLIMLIPPSARGQFSLAYRSLNSRLGATVNCVATEAPIAANASVVNPHEEVPLTTYAQVLEEAGLRQGTVDSATVATYTGFGQYESRTPRGPANQPVIVVEGPTGGPSFTQYAGWALSAVLAVMVVVLAWLLVRTPSEDIGGFGGPGVVAPEAPEPKAQPIPPSELLSELHELMAAMPLPREAPRRQRVIATIERMVQTAGGTPEQAARLSADFDQLRKRNDAMIAFEQSVQSADTNGARPVSAELSSDYPCESASIARREELRTQLTARLAALDQADGAKPLTENELNELDRLLAQYAEYCSLKDSSVKFYADGIRAFRTRLVDSRIHLEKATLDLLISLVGYDPSGSRAGAIEAAKTAEARAVDADGLQAICRQAIRMAAEEKWYGVDAQSLRGAIEKHIAAFMKEAAERLQKIADDEKLAKDALQDGLVPIIADLKKAGDCPMSLVPPLDELPEDNARASDPTGNDCPQTIPGSGHGGIPEGASPETDS